MCKFELLQKDESRAKQQIPHKLAIKLELVLI